MGPCQYFTTTCTLSLLSITGLLCLTAGHLEQCILFNFWLLILIYNKHLQCPITYVLKALTMSRYLYIPSTCIVQVLIYSHYLHSSKLIYSKHLKCPSTYIFPVRTFLKTYNFQALTLSHYNTKPACQYFEKFNSQYAIVGLVVWQPDTAKYAVDMYMRAGDWRLTTFI